MCRVRRHEKGTNTLGNVEWSLDAGREAREKAREGAKHQLTRVQVCPAWVLTFFPGGSRQPWRIFVQEKWHDWIGLLGNSGYSVEGTLEGGRLGARGQEEGFSDKMFWDRSKESLSKGSLVRKEKIEERILTDSFIRSFIYACKKTFWKFCYRNNYKSREKNIMNPLVSITQVQLFSTFGYSCFFCSFFSLKSLLFFF